jgi:hypothetical protein
MHVDMQQYMIWSAMRYSKSDVTRMAYNNKSIFMNVFMQIETETGHMDLISWWNMTFMHFQCNNVKYSTISLFLI